MNTSATTPEYRGAAHSSPEHHGEGVKDTIESLVVAFILAFVFRGFLVLCLWSNLLFVFELISLISNIHAQKIIRNSAF